jgi:hypothetical protein
MNWLIQFNDIGQDLTEITLKETEYGVELIHKPSWVRNIDLNKCKILAKSIADICDPEFELDFRGELINVSKASPVVIEDLESYVAKREGRPCISPVLSSVIVDLMLPSGVSAYVKASSQGSVDILYDVYLLWGEEADKRTVNGFVDFYNSFVLLGKLEVIDIELLIL